MLNKRVKWGHCLASGFRLSSNIPTLISLLLVVPISKILPVLYCCSRDASLQPLFLKISHSLIFLRRCLFSLETVSSTLLVHYLPKVKMYTSCFRYPSYSRSFTTTIIIVHKTGGGIFVVSDCTSVLTSTASSSTPIVSTVRGYAPSCTCIASKRTHYVPGCVCRLKAYALYF